MMHKILTDCRDTLAEAIRETKYEEGEDAQIAVATLPLGDGFIELFASRESSYATVWHDDTDKESPTLEDNICRALPEWDDVEVEKESTEPGLDPAFANWQDYYDYMYN